MNKSLPHILILVCGVWPDLDLNRLPELRIIATTDRKTIFDQHSVNITPEIWQKLAAEIKKNQAKYDGFVVLHNIDNVLYTASAVSFLLHSLKKPIIFTGGNEETKANLINAVQVATTGVPETGLMYGNRLQRANQSTYNPEQSLNKFQSPEYAILGQVDFSVRLFESPKKTSKIGLTKVALNSDIDIITMQPGLSLNTASQRKALILKIGERQSVPEHMLKQLTELAKKKLVVLWWPQATEKIDNKITVIENLTWPATVAKLMWALGQGTDEKKIVKLLTQPVAGEELD